MPELKRIGPLNIRAVTDLIAHLFVGAALFSQTDIQYILDEWRESLHLVFTLVKATDTATDMIK